MVAAATADASAALVIIDVQQGMFMFERPLWRAGDILSRISELLRGARAGPPPASFTCSTTAAPGICWPRGQSAGRTARRWRRSKARSRSKGTQQRLPRYRPARSVAPDRDPSVDDRRRPDGVLRGQRVPRRRGIGLPGDPVVRCPQHIDSPVLTAEQIVAHHNCTLGAGFVALSRTDEVMFRSE